MVNYFKKWHFKEILIGLGQKRRLSEAESELYEICFDKAFPKFRDYHT